MKENTPVNLIIFLPLLSAEMMGSTFTISNLGMVGNKSNNFNILLSEAEILVDGKVVDTPVYHEGLFDPCPMKETITMLAMKVVIESLSASDLSVQIKEKNGSVQTKHSYAAQVGTVGCYSDTGQAIAIARSIL